MMKPIAILALVLGILLAAGPDVVGASAAPDSEITTGTDSTDAANNDATTIDVKAPFSFERWAEAIADGDETITEDEALALAEAEATSLEPAPRSLEPRAIECNHQNFPGAKVASARGAASCIRRIARTPRRRYVLGWWNRRMSLTFCQTRNSKLFGVANSKANRQTVTGRRLASRLGRILDTCRFDGMVQGTDFVNGIAIHITGR